MHMSAGNTGETVTNFEGHTTNSGTITIKGIEANKFRDYMFYFGLIAFVGLFMWVNYGNS